MVHCLDRAFGLIVRVEYDQQRRTFRAAVCEERAEAADGDRAKRRAVGVLHLNRATPGKQGRVCERSEPEFSGDEQSRPISLRQNKGLIGIMPADSKINKNGETTKNCFIEPRPYLSVP